MNFRVIDDHTIGISLDETTSADDVAEASGKSSTAKSSRLANFHRLA